MKKTSTTERERGALERKILSIPNKIKGIKVIDKPSLDRAHAALVYIKGIRRDIGLFCDPNIRRLHEAHKEALAQKKHFEKPLIEAEGYISPQIASYLAKLEQIRRAAEEKARFEREAAERKAREKEEARIQAAREAEKRGELEKAQKILDRTPIQAPFVPKTVVPPKEKLQGVSTRRDWKWEPEDPEGFEGIPREWMRLVPHNEKISAYVKEMKEKAKIPGIRIFFKDTTVTRFD